MRPGISELSQVGCRAAQKRARGKGHPHVGPPPASSVCVDKRARCHTHEDEVLLAEQHGTADDGRVAVEMRPPQMVADDRHSFRRTVVLLVRDEAASERHHNPERVEVVAAH